MDWQIGRQARRSLTVLAGLGALIVLTAADAPPQDGSGVYKFPNGEQYTGMFAGGKFDGKGVSPT